MDNPYLIDAIAFTALFTLVCSVPVVSSGIISWYPGSRPNRKFAFTLISAALSYGFGVIVYLIAIPFGVAGLEIAGHLMDAGRHDLARFFETTYFILSAVAIGVCVIASVAVPILLRRRYWSKLFDADDVASEQ